MFPGTARANPIKENLDAGMITQVLASNSYSGAGLFISADFFPGIMT